MSGTRGAVTTLCLCILLVFLSGPILHSAIPHGHGDEHQSGPGALWNDLHGSLRHEDNQLLAIIEVILATFIALLAFVRVLTLRALPSASISLVRSRDEALH